MGETQCTQAREGWFRAVHPVGMILHSEAGRTVETATRLLEGAAACPTSVLHTLYGGVNSQTNEVRWGCPSIESLPDTTQVCISILDWLLYMGWGLDHQRTVPSTSHLRAPSAR